MKNRNKLLPVLFVLLLSSTVASKTNANVDNVTIEDDVVVADFESSGNGVAPLNSGESSLDYENAKPMPLPVLNGNEMNSAVSSGTHYIATGTPGYSPGSLGLLGAGRAEVSTQGDQFMSFSPADIEPMEYGNEEHPYTTSKVDINGLRLSRTWPYRASGKLYFNVDGGTYVCSASLVKPGVLVTAAHCVAGFGESRFYSNFEYHSARWKDGASNGRWSSAGIVIKTSYYNGTDACYDSAPGVVCENDVAVIRLRGKSGNNYPGHRVGYYGYGWDGWGFTGSTPWASGVEGTQVTQLGYPVSHDGGLEMQRTDSFGYKEPEYVSSTIIGSRQTGGSSGGPWLLNFGQVASLNGAGTGADSLSNVVTGVTSWGYTSDSMKQQGASPFTSNNIVPLVNRYCPSGSDEPWCVMP